MNKSGKRVCDEVVNGLVKRKGRVKVVNKFLFDMWFLSDEVRRKI